MEAPIRALVVTLKRGLAGSREHHRAILASLGLRRRQQQVVQPNTSTVRGALDKVRDYKTASPLSRAQLVPQCGRPCGDHASRCRPWMRTIAGVHCAQTVLASQTSLSAQVKHMVIVETDAMYVARRQREAEATAPRDPIVVRHPTSQQAQQA